MTFFKKNLLLIAVFLTGVSIISVLTPTQTRAASASDFKAGRIIDNNVFFNGSDMDIPTIQAFLNSKMPACDTWGSKIYSGNQTRAQYAASNGKPAPPYTCLKDYFADFYGMNADQYCNAIGYGRFSSAGMIYSVARACNVNPKVLIVLLQKEQSLVTDDWPWPRQYEAATGMGCPDTAPCDPEYAGLFRQLYWAARQYKRYAAEPHKYNTKAQANRTIAYNPNAACGGANVYVENQATAGLYNYTPYQPNQAALNNLYGTGDSCSAYGNRNFWRMYSDWFGSTFGLPFSAKYRGQNAESVTVTKSAKPTVWFDFENTGSQFWKDDASALPYYPRTRLVGTWPINRGSSFNDSSWLNASRPVSVFARVFENDGVTLAADQHTVWPGQVARFQFTPNYPTDGRTPPGSYKEHFELVQDGAAEWWVPGGYAWHKVTVPDDFSAGFRGVSGEANVSPSQNSTLWFKYENTGSQFWKDDASALPYYPRTRLVGAWPINRASAFYDSSSWLSSTRPVSVFTKVYENDGVTLAADQHTVWPGQVAEFRFNVKYAAGLANGQYPERFELVQDGIPNWWVLGSYAWQAVNLTN